MATMVDTVPVEQRLLRLDKLIADAEMTADTWTRIAMERPGDDAFDSVTAMDTMWKSIDFLAALRVKKMNLLLDPTL